jgi:regulator of protease activity HflC (stomatin/prohibitin superfamily)
MPTSSIIAYLLVFFAVIIVFSSFVTVKQGTIAVITIFGKYRRILTPGLNFKIPLIESIYSKNIYPKPLGRAGVPGGNVRPGQRLF